MKTFFNIPIRDLDEICSWVGADNQKFAGKRVLLLGGSGALGTVFKTYFLYLNEFVLDTPCDIISVDNYIGRDKPKEIEASNLTHWEMDLTEPFGHHFKDIGIDFMFCLFGNASPYFYSRYPKNVFKISAFGTYYALELAKEKGAKVLSFSSSEVLSESLEIPSSETTYPCINMEGYRTIYDSLKISIEAISSVYRREDACKEFKGFVPYVVRPFNVISYFSQTDYRVLPNFINSALKNQPLNIYGSGKQTRTFIWYGDFIYGCLKVILNGKSHLFHIANPEPEVNMIHLAHLVEKIAGKSGLATLVESPEAYKFEPRRRKSKIDLAKGELGFEPHVSLEEAVSRVYSWAKDNYKY